MSPAGVDADDMGPAGTGVGSPVAAISSGSGPTASSPGASAASNGSAGAGAATSIAAGISVNDRGASGTDAVGTVRAAIVGLSGPVLTEGERTLLRALPPLGIILFRRNIEHPIQLAALVSVIRDVVPGVLLCVDQEGGRVARLRPPHWLAHPPAAAIGALHARDPAAGLRAAFLCGALIGAECAAAGFDLVCAPVLDLAVPGADAVIGDRAFSADPEAVAVLGAAFADGLLAAGVQPVGKHAPGHGRSLVDSHLALPELDALDEADLLPFHANASMPWMMTAHIRFRAVDPLLPATLSRAVLQGVLRERLGLQGVLVSDDLSMHAVAKHAASGTLTTGPTVMDLPVTGHAATEDAEMALVATAYSMTAPIRTGHAATEDAAIEPAVTGSTVTGPIRTEHAATEDAAIEPAVTGGTVTGPVETRHAATENAAIEPAVTRSTVTGPVTTEQAAAGEPGALAAASIEAGCDVALHCSGVEAETRSVLESVGQPDQAALARLAAAARLAAERRVALDVPSMLAERTALLG